MPYTMINNSSIFYTDEGEGTETILLIHGGTCDSHDWSAQITPFTARHRVIAPDLRGHGRSEAAGENVRPSHYAGDMAHLIEQLNEAPVVAVGHTDFLHMTKI